MTDLYGLPGTPAAAPLPVDETGRLAALDKMRVTYTPAEERFDRLARMACRLLDVPIATVTLVDAERQWFKAREGTLKSEDDRAVSFCAHAILEPETLVVPDAAVDPRFADNPLVTGEPYIRFYAGHPLQAPDGSRLGTLCVIDRRPRAMGESDLEVLRDLAAMTESELRVSVLSATQRELISERDALRRKTMLDPLTGLWNRQAAMEILERELAQAAVLGVPVALVMADIDHFKSINDGFGHLAGDAALHETARRLRSSVRAQDAVGRYGGEEFVMVLGGCDRGAAARIAETVRQQVAATPVAAGGEALQVRISAGVTATDPYAPTPAVPALVQAADQALYRAKAAGRNRVEMGAAP